jgi:DNA-binding Lrp family transcriptional regulator
MHDASTRPELDALDRRLIVATQGGLPRVSRPYDAIGGELGIAGEEVIARLRRMLDTGVIRRIGYTANGMSVWDVDDARIDELGGRVGALEFVTHCYRRPRRPPDWPYNLFAMVHSRTREEVAARVAEIASLLGEACRAHEILYSTAILKKTGLRIAG